MILILKKILPLLAAIFIFFFFPVSVYAYNETDNEISASESAEIYNSSSISFPFTFLGNSYVFNIPFSDNFMPIARDIIFYFLLARSLFTKFKAFPSLISGVPFIGSTDPSKVDYNLSYKK